MNNVEFESTNTIHYTDGHYTDEASGTRYLFEIVHGDCDGEVKWLEPRGSIPPNYQEVEALLWSRIDEAMNKKMERDDEL